MKTKFKKLIIIAAALLFLGLSVSCAHNRIDRYYGPYGKNYGHSAAKKHHPGWKINQLKSERRYSPKYKYVEISGRHYDDSHNRRRGPH